MFKRLWYVVRFDAEHPVDEVAEKLSKLGEVSRVEYNRILKRSHEGFLPTVVDIMVI